MKQEQQKKKIERYRDMKQGQKIKTRQIQKDENGRIKFKDTDLEPLEERKMIGDENDKTREKVRNEKGLSYDEPWDSFVILDTSEAH